MAEKSIISIRNSVIGGLILAALISDYIRSQIVSFFAWLWSGIAWCWDALFDTYAVTGWLWVIIGYLAFIGCMKIYHTLKRKEIEPEFKSYTEDHIFGAVWRWQWINGLISYVTGFCPNCDGRLVYNDLVDINASDRQDKTDFFCENCGHAKIATITGGDRSFAEGAVKREIDRRVRTGEFKRNI